jgi:coniferyl-aldehyde dehydrogenase
MVMWELRSNYKAGEGEMATLAEANGSAQSAQMQHILEKQRASFTAALPEDLSVRRDRIDRAIALLVDHSEDFAKAVSEDFGHRSRDQTLMTDILPSVSALKHAKKHMAAWAKGEKRKPTFPLSLLGAKANVVYQPKGVVGVVSPWNFPIGMVFVPMAGILAAGNRAMIKPSEFTENVSALMAKLIPQYFDETEMAVFTGNADVGVAFSKLAFDHMIFTGATSVGRHIMRAAADNLVPVTLELGGKSPTFIGRSADQKLAGTRVAMGKLMNAGQICLAPDYLLVAEDQEAAMIDAVSKGARELYPTMLKNDDYTSVVNGRNFDRLQSYLSDARAKGAEVIEVNPGNEDFASANGHKMPLHIIRNPTDDMKVMQDEIFGPILPVKTYRKIDEAIDYVNGRDRPLGLYYFGNDKAEQELVLGRTISGGVTVNDVLFHNAMEDLPFGGVGPSGMGNYHGQDGFKTFSHARAVYKQPKLDVAGMAGFKPPYGKATAKSLASQLKK